MNKWGTPSTKRKEKKPICPKCGLPEGVELFTSIGPCDKCLDPIPDEFQNWSSWEVFGEIETAVLSPMGIFTLVALKNVPELVYTQSIGAHVSVWRAYPEKLHVILTTPCTFHIAGDVRIRALLRPGEILYKVP